MAEILEESSTMERKFSKDVGSKASKTLQTKPPWKSRVEGDVSKSKPYEVKKFSREEVQERIKKGLCFKCGDKWSKEHSCKSGKAYVMIEDDENKKSSSHESENDEAEPSEDDEDAELSLNAMFGVQRPTSMRVMAWIEKFEVTLLVDSGSTHNFINSNIVTKVRLKPSTIEPFEVKVANGDKLRCEGLVREVKLNVQGVRIVADLHVLSLVGLDVVLGNAWLKGIGKVVNDYDKMTMEFRIGSKKKLWTALTSKEVKSCEAMMFERLCKGGASCFAIILAKQETLFEVEKGEEGGKKEDLSLLPMEVQEVLRDHWRVLEVPITLPPTRPFDHCIALVDESKLVNVPPYRALNEATIKDRFPISTVDEMLDELHGASIFSKLDLRAGYHQIRMREGDVHKTAFRTHNGHFEYLVMPFGLCNAPSTFQAAMNTIFKPLLRKFVLVFFDNILVYSKTVEDHKLHLKIVMKILEEHHFFIKASKCTFMEKEHEYLGHFISGEGVKVDQRKIEVMVDWPLPMDVSALRGFLGLTGYYRRFVKHYGLIAKPLTSLLKNDNFEWTQEAREAFEELKRAIDYYARVGFAQL
ncbi:uncharacterized protein LOC121235342 [Juglans microcarpa x Juglans regia]|uniref:uncharacterized protein LOC121235342 n=1 Tax=Juglans microcarpa x Juglans regia TaxID=2249226 RepID=UPI001B7E9B2E|nr:uncharacterized protein LOC121235342 [Juglans microcarpa x Juglans regia]